MLSEPANLASPHPAYPHFCETALTRRVSLNTRSTETSTFCDSPKLSSRDRNNCRPSPNNSNLTRTSSEASSRIPTVALNRSALRLIVMGDLWQAYGSELTFLLIVWLDSLTGSVTGSSISEREVKEFAGEFRTTRRSFKPHQPFPYYDREVKDPNIITVRVGIFEII